MAFHLAAHPVPDLPVRSYFDDSDSVEIRVEVDPRSFEADPEAVEYYLRSAVEQMDKATIDKMKATAEQYIDQRLRFIFEPGGERKPAFEWEFRNLGDFEWGFSDAETVLVGAWKFKRTDETSFRIKALKLTEDSMGIPINVIFINFLNRVKAERYAVLFPGETSFALDLADGLEKKSDNSPGDVEVEKGKRFSIGGVVFPAIILIVFVGIWWVARKN